MAYEGHQVDRAPVDRAASLEVARGARRFLIKTGSDILRLAGPLGDGDVARHLVHEDGFLRVPVLVLGDVVVRGYTEALYREALGGRAAG